MSKPLVIVESPAKARTIGKYLGKDYTVKASMGHVRDLPKSDLGVDPEDRFEARWENIESRAKVLRDLRKDITNADTIYLATDPDREGEAIAWHLVESLLDTKKKKDKVDVKRVVFHEITQRAIHEAFGHPSDIDLNRVDAYRTRRILDRLVGYQLSPLLWKKLARGLSAGRVQSVAVRLLVEREREIREFVPEEFWRVTLQMPGDYEAEFARVDGESKELKTQADADDIVKRASGGPLRVASVEAKAKADSAKPPFITSTLQQSASSAYGFSAKRTMRAAQALYEGVNIKGEGSVGLITYMRTDSFNVSTLASDAARSLIDETYGPEYVPEKANSYRSKKGAQEAHEAIRPTDVTRTPAALKSMLKDEHWKLYDLIWRRFVASQMTQARYEVTTVVFERGGAEFEARGRKIVFPGYTRVWGRGKDAGQILPAIEEGSEIVPESIDPTQHFTNPPRRYTEASLVRALEKHGIGRPSTYASILSTIVDRRYADFGEEAEEEAVRERLGSDEPDPPAEEESTGGDDDEEVPAGPQRKRGRAFHATHLGETTTDMLLPFFDDIVNTEFTARLEDDLDRIAEGQQDWHDTVAGFYDKFKTDLATAEKRMDPYWQRPKLTEMPCGKVPEEGGEACTSPMAILFNRYGPYLGCSRYPDCKNTRPLSGVEKAESELTEHTCRKRNDAGETCGRPMERKVNRWGSAFLACTGFKDGHCDGTVSVSKSGDPLWPVETSVPCPDCGTLLVVKRSRRGRFLACTRYPKCRGTLPLPTCPHENRGGKKCGKPMGEPVAGGKMSCKLHPKHKAIPKPSKARAKAKAEADAETEAAKDETKPKAKKKAAKKKAKPKA